MPLLLLKVHNSSQHNCLHQNIDILVANIFWGKDHTSWETVIPQFIPTDLYLCQFLMNLSMNCQFILKKKYSFTLDFIKFLRLLSFSIINLFRFKIYRVVRRRERGNYFMLTVQPRSSRPLRRCILRYLCKYCGGGGTTSWCVRTNYSHIADAILQGHRVRT